MFNKTTSSLFLFLLAFIFSTFTPQAYATTHRVESELGMFEEIPMVFSASRLAEPMLEAPAAISQITSENLTNWGIIDLPDAFRFVPGVDVSAFSGSEWGVTARGFNERLNRRMLILVDGISMYEPFVSGVSWQSIPLINEDIESIEVIRGPNDTLYGFNAFNGVINIKTKDPQDTQGFFGKYVYGQNGRDEFMGRIGENLDLGELGELDFRVSYKYLQTYGYGDDGGSQFPDKRFKNNVSFRLKHELNSAITNHFKFAIAEGRQSLSPIPTGTAVAESRPQFSYLLLKTDFNPNEMHDAYIRAYFWRFSADSKLISAGLPANDSDQKQFDIEVQDRISLWDGKSQTVVGASYRHNAVESLIVNRNPQEANQPQTTTDNLYSVFVNEKLNLINDKKLIHDLTLVAGLRIEGSQFVPNPEWAPRVSLMYAPIKNHFLRATYARAFRLPSFFEEKGDFFTPRNTGALAQIVGNSGLEREEVNSYELGYSGAFFDGQWTLDADGYIAEYTSLVDIVQTQQLSLAAPALPAISSLNNSRTARSYGIEFATEIKPTSWSRFFANYTIQQIRSHNDGNLTGQLGDASPEHKWTLGGSLHFHKDTIENMPFLDGFSINALLHFRGEHESYDETAFARTAFSVKRDLRLDLRIAKSFYDDAFEVGFVGQNLLENKHFEAAFVQVPRLYFLTVTLHEWPWEIFEDKANRDKSLVQKFIQNTPGAK